MKEITPKPEQIIKISQVDPRPGKQGAGSVKTGAFEKLLAEELKAKATTESADDRLEGLPEIDAGFSAQWLLSGFDKVGFTQKLTDALGLLDTYAVCLADPDKTLKQAWDLLAELSDETLSMKTQMDEALDANPDEVDTDLVKMLNQLMTTVKVEQVKINRGDYSAFL